MNYRTTMQTYVESTRKKRPQNCGSNLLNEEENIRLFTCLAPNSYSLCAAVVEVLENYPKNQGWTSVCRGVLSFVKDYSCRAYFLRVFDVGEQTCLWEIEMYAGFLANPHPSMGCLLTFFNEYGSKIYGLNFCDKSEAIRLCEHIAKRFEAEKKTIIISNAIKRRKFLYEIKLILEWIKFINAQQKRYQERREQPQSLRRPHFSGPERIAANARLNTELASQPSSQTTAGVAVATPARPPPPLGSDRLAKASNFLGFATKKKEKKRRIRKEDISNPTNFQHKAHVGWDEDRGFSNRVLGTDMIDESVAKIIEAAGADAKVMDRRTIKFVYDFIDNYQRAGVVPTASLAHFAQGTAQRQRFAEWYAEQESILNSNATAAAAAAAPQEQIPSPAPPPRVTSVQAAAPPGRQPPPPPTSVPKIGNSKPLPSVPFSRPENDPPPPPSSQTLASNPPSAPPAPPPPPANFFKASGAVPPPPPPPPPALPNMDNKPPPQAANPVQPNRGNLLAEIQAGKTLRRVETEKEKPAAGRHGDVLEQIRAGTTLKHVEDAEKRKSTVLTEDLGGIAGALARALAERRGQIASDSDNCSDTDTNSDDWE